MIWRLEYENAHGDVARLDIQRGAATPVETIEGTENPFLLSYELEDKNKKGFIMSSFADISIYETDTFNIDDLKTLDETALSVKWYINSVLEWTGFVVPDFFSRTIGEPAIVNLAASDRLSSLEDATLDGLSEYITLRDLAAACLAKTGLSLPLINTVDFKAKSGQNTIAMMAVYALSDRLEDDKGKKISCFDVLRSILVLSNSTIRQRKGQWRIYNKIQHEALTPSLNFDEVYQGAKRTIQPVFSSVGAFQEFGGSRSFPHNNTFLNSAAGWVAENGFITEFDNRELNYTPGSLTPTFGEETNKINLINRNIWSSGSFDTVKKLSSSPFKVPFRGANSVAFTLEVNARGMPNQSFRYALVKRLDGVPVSFMRYDGIWRPQYEWIRSSFPPQEDEAPFSSVDAIATINADVYLEESEDPEKVTLTVHILGVNSFTGPGGLSLIFAVAIRSAKVVFDEKSDAKGILYRTDQLGSFSKKSDPNTTIFGDLISSGLNGYFYPYPKDDKSILRSPSGSNLPLSKWTTATDPAAGELPLLQHVTRQMSRMFGVAHNVLSAVIDAKTFDPLAIVTNCAGEKYVIVYSVFDFLRSTVEVELQQIAYGSLQKRDFIFSYFGGGDGDGISSIGSVSGGGSSGGSSGGGIPQTLDLLADELFISGGNSVDLGVYARKTWVETEATAFNSARLGGQLAAKYPMRDVNETVTGIYEFGNGIKAAQKNQHPDLFTTSGFFRSNEAPLRYFIQLQHPNSSDYSIQIGNDYEQDELRFRAKNSTSGYGTLHRLWHSGNSNNSSTDWNAKNIVASGNITAQKGTLSSLDVSGNATLRGDRNTLALYYNIDGVAKSRVNEIILGREPDFHKWRILNQSTSSYGNAPNLSFQHLGVTGSVYADVLTMTYSRNVGIGIASPTEKLHVVGNGLFTGNITAQGNLDVSGISTFRDRIGTNAFVSGFTGDGTWRLQTGDETHLTVDRLTVRGRMDVYELVINQIRATNGSLWVTDAMKTTEAIPLSSFEFRFSFDNDNGNRGCTFVAGDIVKAQRFTGRGVVVFVGLIDAVSADDFVINTAGYMPAYTGDLETLAGLEFVRIGNVSNTNRQGSLYLTSSDSDAPYMDVLDGVDSASLAGKTKVRLGKLDGINDLTGYGLYGENTFLTNKLVIGDLTKSGQFLSYENGQLTVQGNIVVKGAGSNVATKEDLDDLEIGGRNLLLKSGEVLLNGSTYPLKSYYYSEQIEQDEIVTFSAWIKVNAGNDTEYLRIYNSDGSVQLNGDITFDNTNTTTIQRVSVTLSWKIGVAGLNNLLYFYSFPRNNERNIDVYKVKLEKGNKATDWSPAPEDVDAEITAAETSAKSYADGAATAAETAAKSFATSEANAALTAAESYTDTLKGRVENTLGLAALEGINQTLITGNKVRTSLLEVTDIVAAGITAGHVEGLTLNFDKGKIGGWTIENNKLYYNSSWDVDNSIFGSELFASSGNQRLRMWRDASNFIDVYNYNDSDWGIRGAVGGKYTFQLGSANRIAGISFNNSRLFTSRWWIDKDGSFSLGDGKITGTAAGNVTIDGSLVTQHITAQSIEGLDLNFTKGTIGGFTIGSDHLFSTDIEIRKNNITINDAGKLIFKQRYNYYSRGNPSIDFYASDTNTMVGALESSARGVILQGYNKFGQNVKSPAMVEILYDQLILGGKLRIEQLEVVHYVENQYDPSLPLPSNWYTDSINIAITRNVVVIYKNFNFANITANKKEGTSVTLIAPVGGGNRQVQNINSDISDITLRPGRCWRFIYSNGNWHPQSF